MYEVREKGERWGYQFTSVLRPFFVARRASYFSGVPTRFRGVLMCDGVMKGKREVRGKEERKRGEREEGKSSFLCIRKVFFWGGVPALRRFSIRHATGWRKSRNNEYVWVWLVFIFFPYPVTTGSTDLFCLIWLLSVLLYYRPKRYCPVLVAQEWSALWGNTVTNALWHDQNRTIPFALIVPRKLLTDIYAGTRFTT